MRNLKQLMTLGILFLSTLLLTNCEIKAAEITENSEEVYLIDSIGHYHNLLLKNMLKKRKLKHREINNAKSAKKSEREQYNEIKELAIKEFKKLKPKLDVDITFEKNSESEVFFKLVEDDFLKYKKDLFLYKKTSREGSLSSDFLETSLNRLVNFKAIERHNADKLLEIMGHSESELSLVEKIKQIRVLYYSLEEGQSMYFKVFEDVLMHSNNFWKAEKGDNNLRSKGNIMNLACSCGCSISGCSCDTGMSNNQVIIFADTGGALLGLFGKSAVASILLGGIASYIAAEEQVILYDNDELDDDGESKD